jgi:hypothetical protein
MVAKPLVLLAAILLSAPAASLAQSQSGGNFGVPYSGAAVNRSNGGYVHSRHRDNGDAAFPVARQASTPK